MTLERAAARPCTCVPEPDRLVARGRRYQLAVRREGYSPDPVRVTLERAAARPCTCVPEPDRLVERGRRYQLAVRREGYSPDPV